MDKTGDQVADWTHIGDSISWDTRSSYATSMVTR